MSQIIVLCNDKIGFKLLCYIYKTYILHDIIDMDDCNNESSGEFKIDRSDMDLIEKLFIYDIKKINEHFRFFIIEDEDWSITENEAHYEILLNRTTPYTFTKIIKNISAKTVKKMVSPDYDEFDFNYNTHY
jgi:hypothetical protein